MEINSKLKVKNYTKRLFEIKNVLYDKNWAKKAKDFPVYHVWRGIKRKGNLRFDLTRINSKMLGREFPKTQGHDHILKTPELIIITKGKALFLYQKRKGGKITDVYCVFAKKGDVVIAPGDYAHFTINPSNKKIEFTNWINEKNLNDYNFVAKMGGACYFYTKLGWIKNKNYKKVPKLRIEKPLKSMPKNLDFLK